MTLSHTWNFWQEILKYPHYTFPYDIHQCMMKKHQWLKLTLHLLRNMHLLRLGAASPTLACRLRQRRCLGILPDRFQRWGDGIETPPAKDAEEIIPTCMVTILSKMSCGSIEQIQQQERHQDGVLDQCGQKARMAWWPCEHLLNWKLQQEMEVEQSNLLVKGN